MDNLLDKMDGVSCSSSTGDAHGRWERGKIAERRDVESPV